MNDSRIDVVNVLTKISSLTFSITAGPNLNSGAKRVGTLKNFHTRNG